MQEMQKMQVSFLDQEDSLEEEMATHSSILAWKIPWREESLLCHSLWGHRVGHDWTTGHSAAQVLYYYEFYHHLWRSNIQLKTAATLI